MTDLAALVVRMQADNSQYIKALDQATSKLNKFSKDQSDLLGDIAKKFAAAFTVEKIAEFSASAIESAAQLSRFAQSAGVSAETLGALQVTMAGSGVDADGLATAFKKLNVAASDAAGDVNSKSAIAFRILGINIRDANGDVKDATTLNDEVADAFSKTADGANKVALAVALYGKQGQLLIPTLDQGSEALHNQEQAAIDAGAVLSGPAAAAAEEAEKKFAQLAATTSGQLKVAIVTALTPALNDVADAFKTASSNADTFQIIGTVIADVFKGIASVALLAKTGIDLIVGGVQSIAAYGAAAVQTLKGNTAGAKAILDDFQAQEKARLTADVQAQAKLWGSGADAQIAEAERGAKGAEDARNGGKGQAPNLEQAVKSNAADQALEKFSEGLRVQAASFGLGSEAAVRYKLSVGDLAKDLAIAGDAGKKAADAAIAYARAFQFKVDTKTSNDLVKNLTEQVAKLDQSDVAAFKYKITTGELGDAFTRMGAAGAAAQAKLITLNNTLVDDRDAKEIQKINDELDKMNGKLVGAAGHAFDLQNKQLTQNLSARGDTAGLARVQAARDASTAEAAYQELVIKGQKIEADYAASVAQVQLAQANGSITDLAAQSQLNDLQKAEIQNLQGIYTAEKQISDTAGIDKLTQQTQAFQTSLVDLQKTIDPMTKQIRSDLENDVQQPLLDIETGSKSAKAAFSDFAKSLQKDLLSIVNKDIAQQIFGQGGAGGGVAGLLASIFGSGGSGAGGGGGAGGSLFQALGALFGNSGSAGSTSTAGLAEQAIGGGNTTSALLSALGGFAGGGTIGPRGFKVVGENGPELAYAGSQDLHIQPMSSGRNGVQVANTFVLQAPGGTITRQSQGQAAAEAARQLSIAARRNG
jgi:hypothetical protein